MDIASGNLRAAAFLTLLQHWPTVAEPAATRLQDVHELYI
jgi:hypothetical protein